MRTNDISIATYGHMDKSVDVTNIVKDHFSQGNFKLKISNDIFGDPFYGIVKHLTLVLRSGERKTFLENTILTFDQIF